MPLEKEIKKAVERYLNLIPKCYVRKTHSSPFSKGWLDIHGVIHGRGLVIELKQPGEKATKLQEKELSKWFKAGAITGVATSVDDVRDLLRAHGIEAP